MRKQNNKGFFRSPEIWIITALAFFSHIISGEAQTILTGGDIAFTGYISGLAADTISFIVLREEGIGATTPVLFTDNGWLASGNGREGEGILEWKADRLFKYGEQVKLWAGSSIAGVNKGTVRRISGNFDLSASGDQLFAFQGSWPASAVLIAGIHYNRTTATTDAGWDVGAASSSNTSVFPSGLCSGCGVWIRNTEKPVTEKTVSAYYKGEYNASPAAFRALLSNSDNWENTFTNTSTGNPAWSIPPVIFSPGSPGGEDPGSADTSIPRIIAVATVMPEGKYGIGDEVNITLYFSKVVIVNVTEGLPTLELNVGNGGSKASYAGGSCSSAITFLYKVQSGDTTSALDYVSGAALQLNKGSMQGINAVDVSLELPSPESGNSLAALKRIMVDARPPLIVQGQHFVVDRAAANGVVIGKVKATDEGPAGELLDWKIIQGNIGEVFSIHQQTGEIAVANRGQLEMEASELSLMLTVSDGVNISSPAEVNISLSEKKQDTIHFNPVHLYENQPAGTLAGSLKLASGSLPDSCNLVTGNGDTHNHLFYIQNRDLFTNEPLDYESQSEYLIRVRVNSGLRFYDTSLVVTLLDINEAPTINPVPDQNVCAGEAFAGIVLSGITAGPEAEQCVTVSASADKTDFFSQLLVLQNTDGNFVLRYKVKSGVTGSATVTILVKDTGGKTNGGIDSVESKFTVTAAIPVSLTIVANGHTALANGESVVLSAAGNLQEGAYQWYLNEQAINGATESSYKVSSAYPGVYYCRFQSGNCSSASNSILVTGADDLNAIVVYPNPAKNQAFISFSGYTGQYVHLLVYNSAGVEMQRKRIWHAVSGQKDEIDITGYAAGIYIVELISEKKEKLGHVSLIIVYQ